MIGICIWGSGVAEKAEVSTKWKWESVCPCWLCDVIGLIADGRYRAYLCLLLFSAEFGIRSSRGVYLKQLGPNPPETERHVTTSRISHDSEALLNFSGNLSIRRVALRGRDKASENSPGKSIRGNFNTRAADYYPSAIRRELFTPDRPSEWIYSGRKSDHPAHCLICIQNIRSREILLFALDSLHFVHMNDPLYTITLCFRYVPERPTFNPLALPSSH